MKIFDNWQLIAEVYSLTCENIFCISFMNWQKRICYPTNCPKEIFGKYLELIKLFILNT